MATIKIKNSQVKDKAPQPSDLVDGELAINTHADSPAVYLKDTAGAVRKIAGVGAVGATAATDTAAGVVELATAAEVTTGTDTTRAVTPAGLKVELDKKAPLASPALTGTPTAPTAAAGTNTTQLATTEFVTTAVAAENLWDRTGTVVSPANAGDVVSISAGTEALPGLTPAGDPNTGIYSPGADQVAISTGGSGRLFVGANGVITIGASSTGFYISPLTGSSAYLATDSASTAADFVFGTSTSIPIRFITGNTERLCITPAGFVGIGTSTPESYKDEADQLVLYRAGNCGITVASAVNGVGALYFADGTSGSDASRGGIYYSHVDNSLQLLADGSARVHITSRGSVGIGDILPDSTLTIKAAAATTPLKVSGPSSEFLRCDQQGRLLVGTSSARSTGSGTAIGLQVEGAPSNSVIGAIRNSGDVYPAKIAIAKTRGTSVGSNTIVQSGDSLGLIEFNGADGTQLLPGAYVEAIVDGTPGANIMPSRLVFSVTPDSKATPEEAMRIKNSKILNFANAPTYADNAAAKAGGLVTGDVYKKADGTLMITF